MIGTLAVGAGAAGVVVGALTGALIGALTVGAGATGTSGVGLIGLSVGGMLETRLMLSMKYF